MADINVANIDGAILGDLLTALGEARLDGAPVFPAVTASTSIEQATECQLTGPGPRAIVIYRGTEEAGSVAGVQSCALAAEILLAVRVGATLADERGAVADLLRLVNAAKNAVEADPPAAAGAWGDGRTFRCRLQWGSPAVDAGERAPWATVRLGLDVAYTLANSTSH